MKDIKPINSNRWSIISFRNLKKRKNCSFYTSWNSFTFLFNTNLNPIYIYLNSINKLIGNYIYSNKKKKKNVQYRHLIKHQTRKVRRVTFDHRFPRARRIGRGPFHDILANWLSSKVENSPFFPSLHLWHFPSLFRHVNRLQCPILCAAKVRSNLRLGVIR